MSRIVWEPEFRIHLHELLSGCNARAVTGPGRSGAISSVYASHILSVPWIPYGQPCPAKLWPLLIIDTARKTGATLRKAERLYGDGPVIILWAYDEPPRVRFWYEREAMRAAA